MPIRPHTHARPTILPPLLLAVGGLIAWTVSVQVAERWETLLFQGITGILAIGAFMTGLYWLAYIVTVLRQEWVQPGETPEDDRLDKQLQLAAIIRSFTPEQTTAFGRARIDIEIVSGHGVPPHKWLVLPEGRFAWEDVQAFMRRRTPTHLASVRWWGTGSRVQNAAKLITEHIIKDGLAIEDVGNEAAKWASPTAMNEWLESIGYTDEDDEEE